MKVEPDWAMLAAAEQAIMDYHRDAYDADTGMGCTPETEIYTRARDRHEVFSSRAAATVAATAEALVMA